MVTESQAPAAGFDTTLLDLNTWEEPKETFTGTIIACHFKWSDPKYNAATDNRVAFPYRGPAFGPEGNSIQQWELNIKRDDARYLLPDGTFADVIVYAGCDLEKLNRKTGLIEKPKKNRSKEMLIINGWTKVFGALVPNPERFVGVKVKVERFREKELIPGKPEFNAKNVTLPIEILAPMFVYSGDVQTIEVKRQDNVDAAQVASGTVVSGQTFAMASVNEAAEKIAVWLKGQHANVISVEALSSEGFPKDALREPFISAFATSPQKTLDTLRENGATLTVGDDGFVS